MQKAKIHWIIIFILLATIIFLLKTGADQKVNQQAVKYEKYTIGKGDTLQSIAKAYNMPGDIRKAVYDLRQLNNIRPEDLYQGQVIIIPVKQ
jgi:LysM repeat protein